MICLQSENREKSVPALRDNDARLLADSKKAEEAEWQNSEEDRHINLSVIIPVRNEEQHLPACLRSLIEQEYPLEQFEIVIADGQSTDRTKEIVREYMEKWPNIKLVDNPRRIVSAGRNAGIRASSGDIVVFVEGHARVAPDFLSHIERCMRQLKADCVGRYVEGLIEGDNYFQRATGLIRKSILGRNVHSLRFSKGTENWVNPQSVGIAYRRSLLDSIGQYDEEMDTSEDVELNYRVERAGVLALQSPKVCYWLHPRSSPTGLFRQVLKYGQGKRLLLQKHPQAFRFAYLVPSAFVIVLLVTILLACVGGGFQLPLLALLALYGTATVGASFALSLRHGFRYLPILPFIYFILHFAFGTGFILGHRGNGAAKCASDMN